MKVIERLCLENWSIAAMNGDRLDLRRGKEYTTSPNVAEDGTVQVFSRFWVRAPRSIFEPDREAVLSGAPNEP